MTTTPEQILLSAMEAIKNEGHVCMGFELCTNESCRSSYTSWAIADEALRNYREYYSFAAK